MIENLDPVLLARIQFAFTISFHILFPAFTIGLASWLAVLEWRWLSTGESSYAQTYRMWVKIFAVTFGMGVVSGVVMSFQFGTNWSVFSDKAGNVLGPLLGYEVLTAFFLEASMWVKIFAVTFGMGVVSGVVMSFQFGTNWSVFSDKAGNVLGPLLGYEVLTAFFLEALPWSDAVWVEPCQPTDAFCVDHHCSHWDTCFRILDLVCQQLDANAPGI